MPARKTKLEPDVSRRDAVEITLREALAQARHVATELDAAMHHAVFSGGQRWRPMLTLAAAELAGGQWADAVPSAAAIELFHCASLVFDDLPCMDDAQLRRGLPAVHVRFGDDIAILAGIGLITTAYDLLACSSRPRRAVRLATRFVGSGGVLTGQALDLLVTRRSQKGRPSSAVNLKSSALIVFALWAGADCGACTDAERRALAILGSEIGQAYQLLDDTRDGDDATVHSDPIDPELARARVDTHLERAASAIRHAFGEVTASQPFFAFLNHLRAQAQILAGELAV